MTVVPRLLAATLALVLVAAPPLGLLLASTAEAGPGGGLVVSVVPWGLALSDPVVGACLWNSVAVGLLVVAAATPAGVALARIASGGAGWRGALPGLVIRLAAGCPPFFAAIGWRAIAAAIVEAVGSPPWLVEGDRGRWLLLGLAQFGFASAWIAWWTGRALERIGPEWARLARVSGAPRGWAWRTVVWPLARPTVARAMASAFAVLLLEPGGPIVLGLRRTVGHQVVESLWMTSRSDLTRGAVLAAVAVLIAAAARLLLVRWGGPDELDGLRPSGPRGSGPIVAAGRPRAALGVALMALWMPAALGPAVAIVAEAARSARPGDGARSWLDDPEGLAAVLGQAMALGGASAVIALLLAWPLSAVRPGRWASTIVEALPPLAIGVGLVGLAQLARAHGGVAEPFGRLLDPYRSPWLLVAWGAALAHLPWAVEAAGRARRIDAEALYDRARVDGDRRAFSRTLVLAPIGIRRCLGTALGVALVGSSALAPAIVLTPLETFRPIGAWVVRDPIGGAAPGLAAVGLLLQMLGVLLLLRREGDPGAVTALRG